MVQGIAHTIAGVTGLNVDTIIPCVESVHRY